ncbi:Gamma-glutamyltranspeptidase family protein [Clavispora lusitaniae]|uniref:Glutathione hydrolase n=1 Tax=Clavispora lusitaniae (strain ATCC 42720) TaxID=306902 RepID=C4Y8F3_CLAL4|nr:uncharacterized protein CLUG_04481 [Clavispora lusitaniae ATCC 42720]EEQ40353.1 hypothetical protein CLUG_04481 [Clavispora lusitaniae ATCC 42720]KAF5209679.1 hypothetical protein E0198_003990 [Clavispora lusitaniae]KAF7581707.1 Gamma-glutamyltranspeptidase family protein [Clavispora lusitaniae]
MKDRVTRSVALAALILLGVYLFPRKMGDEVFAALAVVQPDPNYAPSFEPPAFSRPDYTMRASGRGPSLHPDSKLHAKGSRAMVSCDVPLCATMGKRILLAGGNAADAAVTVALCIGSVNSHSSGIGGGGFIVSSRGNESITIDAREMAPARAHKHMYDGAPLRAQFGGLAVAVPGELAGLEKLHALHGSGNLTWEQLFEPVVELNRRGWQASDVWVNAARTLHTLVLSPAPELGYNWDFIYKPHSRRVVDVGDIVTRPNYANTLEAIARNGSSALFYDPEGPIAPLLAARARSSGGILEAKDFAQYAVNVSPALRFDFAHNGSQYNVATAGGVSSGLALIAGLNFYSALEENGTTSDAVLQTHRLVEAMKWTASARSHLGDVNSTYWAGSVARYTSREWARDLILTEQYADNRTFAWPHYKPLYELTEPRGTSHFSVVDENGGAVGMTTTVNLLFGSSVYESTTGIVLNDEMDDFSLPNTSNAFNLTPSALNFVSPYKRPLSSTAPTIIRRDGQLHLVIGAAGGSRIVTAVLQAIIRSIYQNMPLIDTIAYPRLHHQLVPECIMAENSTMLDEEFGTAVVQNLHAMNHSFLDTGALTAMNAIKRTEDGGWEGVADFWRKRGGADGY